MSLEKFESGAVRDGREGKGRYDCIEPAFLRRIAVVMEEGARKYAEDNWKKGMPVRRCYDSLLRHINQAREGHTDEDHLAHAACNLMFIMHFTEGQDVD